VQLSRNRAPALRDQVAGFGASASASGDDRAFDRPHGHTTAAARSAAMSERE
jgi:hypothetical protein